MVTALGYDAPTVCAGARAGLSRSSVIEHYRIRSEVEGDPEAVVGHQAGLLTRGFEDEARLVRLAQGGLADLLAQTAQLDWQTRRHHFYVSLPDVRRTREGARLIADDDARRVLIERQSQLPPDQADTANKTRAERVLLRAAALAQWPIQPVPRFQTCSGHAGGLEALQAALADLQAGVTEIAVLLGVDSLLDEGTLDWLQQLGRLKCDGAPAGFQPGEAAVAIALAAQPLPTDQVLGVVKSVALAQEKRTLIGGDTAAGEALTEAIALCWGADRGESPWLITDQNGEVYRATDWGHAAVRLRARFESFADPVLWYPGISFGDTGAASALTGICMAVHAWGRHYAPASTALIASASDGAGRAALRLERSGAAGSAP